MCGFFVGLFGALVLMKLSFGMHRRRRFCGGHGGHRHDIGHRYGRGHFRGQRRWLNWLYQHLDTTHGQEKVIREAAEEFEDAVKSAKGLGRKHKRDLADIIRGETFDHEAVGEAWTEQDEALEKVRMALVTSLQKLHEVLEPRQRARLADMLDGAW